MAKINFGGVVQDARGKQNGIVYSKNRSGAYLRRKVTGTNPNTVAQQLVRSSFGNLSKQWGSSLTQAQRDSWTTYANTYPRVDIFGNSIRLSGSNMFIALNAVLLNLGGAFEETPPASNLVTPIPVDATSGSAVAGTSLTFQQTAVKTGNVEFYIFATGNVPPGRIPGQSVYRFIGIKAAATSSFPAVLDILSLWFAKFGDAIAGQFVYLQVATVNTDTGLLSVPIPFGLPWT